MTNNKDDNKQSKPNAGKDAGSNSSAFIIIAVIFVATGLGIWYITSSGGDNNEEVASNTATPTSTANQQTVKYANAPAGATPAHVKGSEDSQVVVEEFADYQCPGCAKSHPLIKKVVDSYGDKIKFVYRNYPLVRNHQNSYAASVAAEAAGFQDKFWEMQDLIFSNQSDWESSPDANKKFEEYAKSLGLDMDKFSSDSLGLNAKNRVDEDMKRANAIGVNSTPSLFINGVLVSNSAMSEVGLAALIDAELAKFGGSTQESSDDKPADTKEPASDNSNTNANSEPEYKK